VWSESNRDNLSVVAAGCAFFALFAIFPALSALISLYGLTADPATVEREFGMLGSVLPAQAYGIVIEQIHRIAAASGRTLGWSLAVSLGLALCATGRPLTKSFLMRRKTPSPKSASRTQLAASESLGFGWPLCASI
jgi:uncharacterized BrkB/YihY/UPF0761 family membrane protein